PWKYHSNYSLLWIKTKGHKLPLKNLHRAGKRPLFYPFRGRRPRRRKPGELKRRSRIWPNIDKQRTKPLWEKLYSTVEFHLMAFLQGTTEVQAIPWVGFRENYTIGCSIKKHFGNTWGLKGAKKTGPMASLLGRPLQGQGHSSWESACSKKVKSVGPKTYTKRMCMC